MGEGGGLAAGLFCYILESIRLAGACFSTVSRPATRRLALTRPSCYETRTQPTPVRPAAAVLLLHHPHQWCAPHLQGELTTNKGCHAFTMNRTVLVHAEGCMLGAGAGSVGSLAQYSKGEDRRKVGGSHTAAIASGLQDAVKDICADVQSCKCTNKQVASWSCLAAHWSSCCLSPSCPWQPLPAERVVRNGYKLLLNCFTRLTGCRQASRRSQGPARQGRDSC